MNYGAQIEKLGSGSSAAMAAGPTRRRPRSGPTRDRRPFIESKEVLAGFCVIEARDWITRWRLPGSIRQPGAPE